MKVKKYLPSLITLTNLFLGFLSILVIQQGLLIFGCSLILIAAILDSLDGKLARKIGVASSFGKEIDSLADLISFCLAPSFLIFNLFYQLHDLAGNMIDIKTNPLIFFYLAIISSFPVLMGAIRLARFNIGHSEESKSTYFIGLPSPMAAISICSIVFLTIELNQIEQFLEQSNNNYIILQNITSSIIILLSFLMISKIHFAKFPLFSFYKGKKNSIRLILLFLSSVIMIISIFFYKTHITLFCFSLYYVISNIAFHFVNNSIRLNELKEKLKNKKRVK